MSKKSMGLKAVFAFVLSAVLLFQCLAAAAEAPAEGGTAAEETTEYDVNGSKTAAPTELVCQDKETTVTLSLPSAEYQNKIDIVFVMDQSTSTKNSGIDFSENVGELLNSVVANNTGVELKVGIVKFRGYATNMLGKDAGLVIYDDTTSAAILAAVANNEVPGSGSNGHSGLVMAEQLLSADTDVDDDHKYVVFLTDGKNYIWNNADNEPVTIYQQAGKSGSIQAGGKPRLNQYDGITQKENGAYPSIYNSIPQITGVEGSEYKVLIFSEGCDLSAYDSTYYTNLFNSTHAELKGPSDYDSPAYYTKFYPEDTYNGTTTPADGTVTTHAITNTGTDVIPNVAFYKTYYEFTPMEGTFWADVKYLETNPYEVVLNQEDGKYYYDTNSVNPDFFLWHPSSMEKGTYTLGHYWKETIAAKYNTGAIVFYDTGSGTGSHITQSFDQWLVENSDFGAWIAEDEQVLALFEGIDNSIRYMVSQGVVTDVVGADFTLKNADAAGGFRMTLNGEAVACTFADGKWNFGTAAEGVYPYVVEYNADTKTITWTINVPIENLKPVTLSYDLILKDEAESGFYNTNESAVLDYKSSDGKKDGTYTFDVPQVGYVKCIEINVEKSWEDANDQDGKRPDEVTVVLLAGDTPVSELTLTAQGEWKGTFEHDPTNDVHLPDSTLDWETKTVTPIEYDIQELEVEDYDTDISGSAANGFLIVNTHTPEEIELEGSKIWDDADDQDGKRPDSVTIHLFAGADEVGTFVLDNDNEWYWRYTGPKYANGEEIEYTITEDEVEGYEADIEDFDVTNTHVPETVELTITKIWDDAENQDGIRPDSVTVHLMNGETEVQAVEVKASEDWKAVVEVPKYAAGQVIAYTITEDEIEGYEADIEDFIVTNTHTPEEIQLEGAKVWDDDDNAAKKRPSSVMIRLYADGTEVAQFELDADNEWSWLYTAPKYADGNKIEYTITEDEVEGYTCKIEGFVVTNSIVPETGDHFDMFATVAALVISVVACTAMIFLAVKRRKESAEG